MPLQTVYQELRTLAVPTSAQEEQQRSLSLFYRMMQIVGDPDLVTHPELRALTTLIAEHIQHQIIPVTASPFDLPSLSFIVWQQGTRLYPMITVPEHYLTQVREDPLFQFGGIVDTCSRVRDYLCGKLEVSQTALRASAFEAELRLASAPQTRAGKTGLLTGRARASGARPVPSGCEQPARSAGLSHPGTRDCEPSS
jgi:hypothetical protein